MTDSQTDSLQLFTPDLNTLRPIEVAAQVFRNARHIVLVCCRRTLSRRTVISIAADSISIATLFARFSGSSSCERPAA